MEVDKIMSTLLTLGANSSTPRRHGSVQNNENIANTRGKLEHTTKTWAVLKSNRKIIERVRIYTLKTYTPTRSLAEYRNGGVKIVV